MLARADRRRHALVALFRLLGKRQPGVIFRLAEPVLVVEQLLPRGEEAVLGPQRAAGRGRGPRGAAVFSTGREGELESHPHARLGLEVGVLGDDASRQPEVVAQRLDGLRIDAWETDSNHVPLLELDREVAQRGELLDVGQGRGQFLEGAGEVHGQHVEEAVGVEGRGVEGGDGLEAGGGRVGERGREGAQGRDGRAQTEVDVGARGDAGRGRHLARGLVLQRRDGTILALAAGAEPVELRLLPGHPERAHGGRHVLHDLGLRRGRVREVPGPAHAPGPEPVAAGGARQGAPGEVRPQGAREGGAARELGDGAARLGVEELGAVEAGGGGGGVEAAGAHEAADRGVDVLVRRGRGRGRALARGGVPPAALLLAQEGGGVDRLARVVRAADEDGLEGGVDGAGGVGELRPDQLARLVSGATDHPQCRGGPYAT